MSSRLVPKQSNGARAPRADGNATRRQILETAGPIYAEKGFARTTTKEICAAAGVNIAAVNYHFGGKDGLYRSILAEAHRQIVGLDELEAITGGSRDVRTKIRAVVRRIVTVAAKSETPWGIRVVVRELMAPSAHAATLFKQAIAPKARVVRGLVAEMLGLPIGDAKVDRGLGFVMLPAIALAIAPKRLLSQVAPTFMADPEVLADDLADYVVAGLEALRRHGGRAAEQPGRSPRTRTRQLLDR